MKAYTRITPFIVRKLIKEDLLTFDYIYKPSEYKNDEGPVYSTVVSDRRIVLHIQPHYCRVTIRDGHNYPWDMPSVYEDLLGYHDSPKQKLKRALDRGEID